MYPLGSGFIKGLNFRDKRLFRFISFFPTVKDGHFNCFWNFAYSRKNDGFGKK